MGQVFLCNDLTLQRQVAVKFLKDVEIDPNIRSRFLNEARAVARLMQANIVTIFRVGEVAGTPYLASEYIHGQSLDKLPLPLPFDRVLNIALGMARGLSAAHTNGVVHRDIKPARVHPVEKSPAAVRAAAGLRRTALANPVAERPLLCCAN